jgi:AcrR family transcriptional regulator
MTLAAAQPDRQDTILDAAFSAFAAYGYRRTTMEDIARNAGLSRTALYQHFRSKEDILRSLTVRHFSQTVVAMEEALNSPGQNAEKTLYACFLAKDGKIMDVALSSLHGAELLDASHSVSSDLVREGTARAAEILTRWIETRGLPSEMGTAKSLASMIMAALYGLKSNSKTLEEFRAGEAQLAKLIAHTLV